MKNPRARKQRWILVPIVLVLLVVTGYAVQQSVTIRTTWKVLPYQTLRLSGTDGEVEAIDLVIPEPTPLDYARGYIEVEHAVRLHVVSNTSWKIQVTASEPSVDVLSDLSIRSHGEAYQPLSADPRLLTQGANGVFEISVDYRLVVHADDSSPARTPISIIYTIMSN